MPKKFTPLVSDSRLIEIARGFVADRSTPNTRPDMSNEHNLLELLRIVVDEAAARIPLWELEKRQSKYVDDGGHMDPDLYHAVTGE